MRFNCHYAIFDNDGTILNSMYYWRLAPLEYAIEHGLPIPEDMTLREMFSSPSRNFLKRAAAEHGLNPVEVLKDLEERVERHYLSDARPKPGAEEFLRRLSAAGARMCVATAAPRERCASGLRRFDLLKCFEFVTDGYEVGLHKGDPEFFRSVAARLGTVPGRCWVFEDALYAIRGAKEAGAKVCAIDDYTSHTDREEIMALADLYVKDYRELLD